MTKKDYVVLAAGLKAEKPGANWEANKYIQWRLDVQAVAKVCQWDNPRFNRDRFYAACGTEA